MAGGRVFPEVVREVCDGALATIALGSCAFDGGLSGAAGGQTGAVGVGSVVGTDRLVNLPGCPVNAQNLTATIVHYVTFGELPARDMRGRPLFAYGGLVHNQCERRSHFEYGEFVQAWGDEAAQKGWCLYKMGCKGPETFSNCPSIRYGDGGSWPVKVGHGCIGCTMPAFWDAMSPFYQRLPSPFPFAPDVTVDQVGGAAVVGVAALTAAHGAASYARQRIGRVRERRLEPPEAAIEPVGAPPEGTQDDVTAFAQADGPSEEIGGAEFAIAEPESVPISQPDPLERAPATPPAQEDMEDAERGPLPTTEPRDTLDHAPPADAPPADARPAEAPVPNPEDGG
jgi:hydrogenase small subunit